MTITTHANNQVEIVANCGLHRTSNLLQPARLVRVRFANSGHVTPYWAEMLCATGGFNELLDAINNAPMDLLNPEELRQIIGRSS